MAFSHFFLLQIPFLIGIAQILTIYEESFMELYLTLLKLVLVTIDVISKQRKVLKKWLKICMPFKLFVFRKMKCFDVNYMVFTAPSEPANPMFIS